MYNNIVYLIIKYKDVINLNITGIITEYNPLHKGHVHHINKTKEITKADGIVCVMSGNFVQRGIPALLDKWNRTKMALYSGVDLVIELPTIYSLSSAEFFSYGSVSLLNSLGIVNNLCFGSELGEPDFLYKLAEILVEEPTEFKIKLKDYLKLGLPFPIARSKALEDFIKSNNNYIDFDLKDILSSSNNILGIEYCKSLIKLNSKITPFSIKREGSTYNSENLNEIYSSATSIRKALKDSKNIDILKNHVPLETFNILKTLHSNNYNFTFEDSLFSFIKYKYYTGNKNINKLPDASEGIDNKIYKGLDNVSSYNELLQFVKSKRYTYTRINRILCQYFVGFENYNTQTLRKLPCPYIRVLGFNNNGTKILKEIKLNSTLPIYTKIPKEINEVISMDLQATKAYSLINQSILPNSDYLTSPIRI